MTIPITSNHPIPTVSASFSNIRTPGRDLFLHNLQHINMVWNGLLRFIRQTLLQAGCHHAYVASQEAEIWKMKSDLFQRNKHEQNGEKVRGKQQGTGREHWQSTGTALAEHWQSAFHSKGAKATKATLSDLFVVQIDQHISAQNK